MAFAAIHICGEGAFACILPCLVFVKKVGKEFRAGMGISDCPLAIGIGS